MRKKIVRIFISSTFEDMKRERTILQERVYPYLVNTYTPQGWQIELVDLRWGISREAGVMQKTMRICLEELHRCQQVSPRPNFLILHGQRYGWRPLPEIIPYEEWMQVLSFAETYESSDVNIRQLLEKWYIKDENNIPCCMELAPRTGVYAYDYDEYSRTVEWPLVQFFMFVGQHPDFKGERSKYTASATEQEILAGALNENVSKNQVVAYFRNITDVSCYPEKNSSFIDSSDAGYASEALKRLKKAIIDKLDNDSWVECECRFDKLISGFYDDRIEDDLRNLLVRVIDNEMADYELNRISNLEEVLDRHKLFAKDRVFNFQGRNKELDIILNETYGKFILLAGNSGTGKSALMSKAVEMSASAGNESRIVIFRSVGIGNISTGHHLITSIMDELSVYGIHMNMEFNIFSAEDVVSSFSSFLQNYSGEKKIILFIDALDQLHSKDILLQTQWIPSVISDKVKLVVSIIAGYADFTSANPVTLTLGGLETGHDSRRIFNSILEESMKLSGRKLTIIQEDVVYNAYCSGGCIPLFLKIVSNVASRWRHNDIIEQGEFYSEKLLPDGTRHITLPDNVETLVSCLMGILAKPENFGMIVRKAFSYMLLTRRGVSDAELISMLSLDKEFMENFRRESFHEFKAVVTKFPPIIWTRFYYEIKPYLVTKSVLGGNVLGFYHRLIENAVTGFLDNIDRKSVAEVISHHFASLYKNMDARTLEELPASLIKSGNSCDLFRVLTDVDFIQSKAAKGLLFDLLEDFRHAIRMIDRNIKATSGVSGIQMDKISELPYSEVDKINGYVNNLYYRNVLTALLKFVMRDTYMFLDFAHLYRYWTLQHMGNTRTDPILRKIYDKYISCHFNTDFELYLRINGAENKSDNAVLEKLQGHDWCVRDICISSDYTRAVSVSDDRSCIVWNIPAGTQDKRFRLHSEKVAYAAADDICNIVLSATEQGEAFLWDTHNGNIIRLFQGYSRITSVGISYDGKFFMISGEKDRCVMDIYTSYNENQLFSVSCYRHISASCFARHSHKVYFVADGHLVCLDCESNQTEYVKENLFEYNADIRKITLSENDSIISVLYDYRVSVYSLASMDCLMTISLDKARIIDFDSDAISARFALAADDNKIYIWNVSDRCIEGVLIGHSKDITSVRISDDGGKVISVSRDRRCILWNSYAAVQINDMNAGFGSCVYMSRPLSDGTVYAGSDSDYLQKWNDSGDMSVVEDLKIDAVFALDVSADGKVLAWSNGDRVCWMYNQYTGKLTRILKGVYDTLVNSIRFSYSGRYIISNAIDKNGGSYGYVLAVTDGSTGENILMYTEKDLHVTHPWGTIQPEDNIDTKSGVHPVTGRYVFSSIDMVPDNNKYFVMHINSAYATSVSPDGTLMAVACRDNTIVVYDMATGHIFKHLGSMGNGHSNEVKAVAFMPDGKSLVSGSWDNSCILWDLLAKDGEEMVRRFTGHTRGVYALDVAPDGKTFISGARDRSCIIWDVDGGIRNVYTADSACNSVYFLKNGFIAGFDSGDVVVTENTLGTVLKSAPVITIGRIWKYDTNEYDEFSYVCPHCGHRVYDVSKQVDYITKIRSEYGNPFHPALELPEKVWNDNLLNIQTPCCGKNVRINPYVNEDLFKKC